MTQFQGSGWVVALVAFVAVALVVITIVLVLEALREWNRQRAVSSELRKISGAEKRGVDPRLGLVRAESVEGFAWLEPLLMRLPRRTDFQHFLDQADIGWSVGTFVMLTVGLAAACGLGALIGTRMWLAALGAAVFGSLLPYLFASRKRKQRYAAFEEHFPESIDLLGRAVRAGHAFSTGLRVVAEESPEPVSTEFRQVYEEQKFGLPLSESLLAMSDRMAILDVRIFVTAVLIQLESGGNLAEILDNLAKIIRDRFKFRRQLRVHTAHGRMTGMVLVSAPFVAGFGMWFLNPDYMGVLFEEPLGRVMLVTAVGFQLLGFIFVRRIMDVEV